MAASKEQHIPADLLRKYLAGNCTPEEKAKVVRWYEQQANKYPVKAQQQHEVLNKIQKELLQEIRSAKARGRKNNLAPWATVAALFMLTCGLALWYKGKPISGHNQINTYNAATQKQVFSLADGTLVALDAGSSLILSADFNQHRREVTLKGQAFFDVKTDSNKPFVIHSFGLETEVLGTSFNVKAFAPDQPLEVSVASGQVKAGGYQLAAGKKLNYSLQQQKGDITEIEPKHIGAWRTGSLYFEDATIEEIVRDIRWMYKTDIRLQGVSKAACRYTFNLKNEKLEDVLHLLKTLTGIRYRINKNQIIMDSSHCI